jgi:hypothetical protein
VAAEAKEMVLMVVEAMVVAASVVHANVGQKSLNLLPY